jgi:hypothetical protein
MGGSLEIDKAPPLFGVDGVDARHKAFSPEVEIDHNAILTPFNRYTFIVGIIFQTKIVLLPQLNLNPSTDPTRGFYAVVSSIIVGTSV